jgi:hypothetical protein
MSAKEVMMEMNEYKALPRAHLPQFLHLDHLQMQPNGTRFKRGAASAAQCEGLLIKEVWEKNERVNEMSNY